MKCIVCDRCKEIINNPRHCRVITCARPLKPLNTCGDGKVPYRGNDRQQNDIIWEKELCDTCLDELEAFFEVGEDVDPHPPEPVEPDPDIPDDPDDPGEGGEDPPDPGDDGDDGENPGDGETGGTGTDES